MPSNSTRLRAAIAPWPATLVLAGAVLGLGYQIAGIGFYALSGFVYLRGEIAVWLMAVAVTYYVRFAVRKGELKWG